MQYHPTVIIPPAQNPVSLAEMKDYLHATGTGQDSVISGLITAATQICEDECGRAFYAQTLEHTLDQFPWENNFYNRGETCRFTLPRATPLQSVTSITWTDNDGAPTTLDPTTYIVDTDSDPGQIALVFGSLWPTSILRSAAGVRIRYVAGYVAGSPLVPFPETIRLAIMRLVHQWYDNREPILSGPGLAMVELPNDVRALLARWRIESF